MTTKTNYLINMILYFIISLIFIAIASKIANKYQLNNSYYLVTALVLTFISIYFMSNDNKIISHIALVIFIISIGILLSIYSVDITISVMMTTLIVFILLLLVYFSSEDVQVKMASYLPTLNILLLIGIIVGVILIFSGNVNNQYYNIIMLIIFMLYVITNTSIIILNSKYISNGDNINYPKEIVGLILNYVNILSIVNNMRIN